MKINDMRVDALVKSGKVEVNKDGTRYAQAGGGPAKLLALPPSEDYKFAVMDSDLVYCTDSASEAADRFYNAVVYGRQGLTIDRF